MPATIHDDIFDDGLDAGLKALADLTYCDLHICSQQPTTYAQATSTYTLGDKNIITITGPAAGDVSGRKVTVSAINDGDVTATGTATHFAIVDTNSSRLLVTQALSASASVTAGNTFTLTAFDVEINDPTS
jgi:hypothetical protein